MEKCILCPRNCKANRTNKKGFCNASNTVNIAKVMLHHWEEPIISGTENQKGSGTIFFSHCNLKCVYCQNYEIIHNEIGKNYTEKELANLFKKLEEDGALNINLVTPTHYTTQIINALKIYKPKIPVVWNTSGYENVKTIKALKGLVDVFLTDFKYYSNELSNKYSNCKDYFENCTQSIIEMRKICPKDIIENGIMQKGLIIRHLILPDNTKDSLKILDWIKNNLGTKTFISLMSQFTPNKNCINYPELNRSIKPIEYKKVLFRLELLGFENGFVQDLSSSNNCYTPNFKKE